MYYHIKKQLGFTLIELIIIIVILLAIYSGIKQQLQKNPDNSQKEVILQGKDEVQEFVKKTIPELFTKITDVNKMLVQADSEINRLAKIKNKYSRQADVVQPRLERWQQTKAQLLKIQQQIEFQTEKAFVIYQVNQGSKDFEQVAQGLIKQADEALNMAKQIESAVQETTSH